MTTLAVEPQKVAGIRNHIVEAAGARQDERCFHIQTRRGLILDRQVAVVVACSTKRAAEDWRAAAGRAGELEFRNVRRNRRWFEVDKSCC